MQYYNSKGELVEYNFNYAFSQGDCARVYKKDDIIFKKYYSNLKNGRISYDIFEMLKSIDNPHLLSLLDTFYIKDEVIDYERFKNDIRSFIIDAYTYKFVGEDNIDILTMPTDYTLDNLSEIEKLIEHLTSLHIQVLDLKRDNSLLTNDRIILIDPDLFNKCDIAMDNLKAHNNIMLMILFKSIFLLSLSGDKSIIKGIYRLFEIEDFNSQSLSYEVSRKLTGYKRPIDYLRR